MAEVVNLEFNDLVQGKDLTAQIERAYGPEGLGVLTVSGVPNVTEFRQRLLTLGHAFATLTEEQKKKYEHPESNYSFGWSHGKESFAGKRDVLKGSFYNNPQYDEPTQDEELKKQYPFYCCPNIWPKQEVPELEHAFKDMGRLMVSVGELVAKQCDRYVAEAVKHHKKAADIETESYKSLNKVIVDSRTCKARLLYYFPLSKEQIEGQSKDASADSWCGWHLDHGSLTGLTNAMYMHANDGSIITDFKDEAAGLYIQTRTGDVVKAKWSADRLAFQIGESAQIHSGGLMRATPHCVRGTTEPGVARITYAVFMQPQWDVSMAPPKGMALSDCDMPVLKEGMDFNAFTAARLATYYGTGGGMM